MPHLTYPEMLQALMVPAEGQDGYFTTDQAAGAGVDAIRLAKLAKSGHVERYHQAIYRIVRWPGERNPGLWPVLLWAQRSSPRAALSHRTALNLHGVSDINPRRIDVTIPPGVRVRSAPPRATVIHRRALPDDQVEQRDNLRITTLYRTLLDLAVDHMARSEVEAVLDGAGNDWIPLTDAQARQVRACYDLDIETISFLIKAKGARVRKG